MHISEWIDRGCPENEWFTITRHVAVSDVKRKENVLVLGTLIKMSLARYGDYEIDDNFDVVSVFKNGCSTFNHDGATFIVGETSGTVNGKIVPVIAVTAKARIVKARIYA